MLGNQLAEGPDALDAHDRVERLAGVRKVFADRLIDLDAARLGLAVDLRPLHDLPMFVLVIGVSV